MKNTLRKVIRFSIISALYLFGIIVGFEILVNPSYDSTALTNYGFAIFIGITSVCFSWSRNLVPEAPEKSKLVEKIATDSLSTSIIFLTGSLVKFIATLPNDKLSYLSEILIHLSFDQRVAITITIHIISSLFFGMALSLGLSVFSKLIKVSLF